MAVGSRKKLGIDILNQVINSIDLVDDLNDIEIVDKYDYVMWLGDLNYRIDLERDELFRLVDARFALLFVCLFKSNSLCELDRENGIECLRMIK